MTQQSTLHGRGRRKMVAATGDGRWMITATTMMRGNARGGEEEVYMTIEDERVGKDNDTTDNDDRRNNTTIKRFTGEGVGGDGEE
jgi:hypothetical protein